MTTSPDHSGVLILTMHNILNIGQKVPLPSGLKTWLNAFEHTWNTSMRDYTTLHNTNVG